MMHRVPVAIAALLLSLLTPRPLAAQAVESPAPGPLPRAAVPDPLKPWIDWVLRGHEPALCPQPADGSERVCFFPSSLRLDLDERSGTFTARWLARIDGFAALPGDEGRWPLDVLVDGRPAAVALRSGRPHVALAPGRHTISGRWSWPALPDRLALPPATGLVDLEVRGEPVAYPGRDAEGRLWLQRGAAAAPAAVEDRLEIKVHRLLADEVPLRLTTRLVLEVSGARREQGLARALPAGFEAISLGGSLPARLEPDGQLLVRLAPGSHELWIEARDTTRGSGTATVGREKAAGPWADHELWVFDARPALRLVELAGGTPIDPSQSELPEPWRRLPAYRLEPGEALTLEEKRRGDADPPPDRFELDRSWWLDFDGRGFTVEDQVSGTAWRSTRLEMGEETRLGRVLLSGRDELITSVRPDGRAGVELATRSVAVRAESRVEGRAASTPAVGWGHDFQRVAGRLHLPPGWRLLHASGVDQAASTWIQTWSLLDIFLMLVTAAAVGRLWSRAWGGIALATLALTYPEAGAPRVAWLAVLAGVALARVLPAGRIARALSLYRLAALAALAMIAMPFLVHQVCEGLYPALEEPGRRGGSPVEERFTGMAKPAAAPVPSRSERIAKVAEEAASVLDQASQEAYGREQLASADYDRRAVVQTGPGLPRWQWSTVSLVWSGPVEASQRLRLFLLSPRVNLLLALLRVLLVAALFLCLLGPPGRFWPAPLRAPAGRVAALALALVLATMAAPPATSAGEIPPPELLEELRARLLAPPACHPSCASCGRLQLVAEPARLTLRLEIDAQATAAVPLPGSLAHWQPRSVTVDGAAAEGLVRTADGTLWLLLETGRHEVVVEGELPPRDSVQVPLPLKPHRGEVRATGYTVEGIHPDGSVEGSLELRRVRPADASGEGSLEAGTLPPFVRIERRLHLGRSWEVETRAVRLSPPGAAFVAEVALLEGESVTTPDVRVTDGRLHLVLPAQASEAAWRSVLAERGRIELEAAAGVPWVEVWRLEKLPVWHVERQGIPALHDEAGDALEWRPWPGETVTLAVSRPAGVEGQTLTVERTLLALRPGLRASDATLTLELRSSRGGQHTVTLPEGAELQSVSVGGQGQPLRQDGRKVSFPVVPGGESVEIAWRTGRGIGIRLRTPEVDLGSPGVNGEIQVEVPASRWVLWLRGPRLGPAVLFWSLLVVLWLVSLGLGRLSLTPLRARHWLLLGVGLSQATIAVAALVAGWLLALGWRRLRPPAGRWAFNLTQCLLVLWTVAALSGLVAAIGEGLLGRPEMQIEGNGSSADQLRWYQDRTDPVLPRASVVSVPLLVYRAAMLAWALWIASALIGWLRWGWGSFSEGGLWRSRPGKVAAGPAPPGDAAGG